MGAAMAGHIAKSGCSITVFNRSVKKSIAWVEAFAGNNVSFAKTASDASIDADFVISCVGKDDDLEEITTGETGSFKTMKEGSIFIDHTTTSSEIAFTLSKIASSSNIQFMDAPVSGGNLGARKGLLSIMCGGDSETFYKSKTILDLYSKSSSLVGGPGSGQLAKMVNQICIAGLLQGLAEGMNFGRKAGLDMKKVIEIISKGAASSWQMENRSESMLAEKYDFGFAVDLMRKDLSILFKAGDKLEVELPVTRLVDSFYGEIQELGFGKFDTSSLLKRLQQTSS